MAHRRTSSLVTQHQHQSKHHSPANSPVIEDEDQMPAHYSSAVGVGFHSFLSSSSAQSQTLPTIRDSLHVDVLLPEHTPQSPGTPSKLFPHPSPSTPSSSTLSPSSSSSSLTAYSPGSPRSRPLLRRLLNYISPSPSSSSASLLPLKSPLPSPTRTSHPYLLPSKKQRSPISSSHKFSPFSLTRLTSKSRLNSLSLPFPLPSRRRTTFIALLALLLISTWTILTTSLSSSSSSSPVSVLGPEGRGRTGSNKDKGWRALYLGVGVDVKSGGGGGGGSTSGSSEDDKLLSFLGTSTSSPYNNANSNTRMKKPKHGGGGAQRYRAGANGGGEAGEGGIYPDGNDGGEYLEGEDSNGGGMEEEVLREDEEYTLSPRAELAALTSFMASLPWNALPSYVDPSKPLSPDLVLDFDLRRGRSPSKGRNINGNGNGNGKDGEREREEDEQLEELIRETWRDNPVVIFGKGRHARTRELRALIEKGLIVVVDDERSSSPPSPKGGKKNKNKNKKVKAVGVKGVTYFEMDARVDREVVEPVLHRLIYGSDSDATGKKTLEYPLLLVGGKNVPIGFGEGEEYVQLLERESVRALVDVPALRIMKPGSGSDSGAGAEGGVDKVDQERDVDKENEEEEEREKEVDGESELVKKLRAAGARVEEIVKKKGKGRK